MKGSCAARRCPTVAARLLVLAAAAAVAAGCAFPGPAEQPTRRSWLLQAGGEPGVAVEPRTCIVLRIGVPQAAPGFNTARMAYMTTPDRLDFFAHHAWADTPPKMLAASFEMQLMRSGLLGAVVSGAADVRSDYRLDSSGIRVLQEVEGEQSAVTLRVAVRLVELASRRVTASRTFEYREHPVAANPQAGVAAANRAAARFTEDLLRFLDQGLRGVDCSAPDSG